jgi:hypothetical protein
MERRTFLKIGAGTAGAMLVPVFGNAIAAEELLTAMPVAAKKALADTALDAATKAGASYCDVRIGRYLNQYIVTRDLNVENVTNTESAGVGVRVVCNGAYGFAATSDMTPDGIAGAARQAVAIAKANAKLQSEPVRLAPVKGVGEVAWATPIVKDWRTVPIKDKAELLIAANKACSRCSSRSISRPPTARTSTRTCSACGRRSPRPPSTRPAASSARGTACRRPSAWAMNTWTPAPSTRSRPPAASPPCTRSPMTSSGTRVPRAAMPSAS